MTLIYIKREGITCPVLDFEELIAIAQTQSRSRIQQLKDLGLDVESLFQTAKHLKDFPMADERLPSFTKLSRNAYRLKVLQPIFSQNPLEISVITALTKTFETKEGQEYSSFQTQAEVFGIRKTHSNKIGIPTQGLYLKTQESIAKEPFQEGWFLPFYRLVGYDVLKD